MWQAWSPRYGGGLINAQVQGRTANDRIAKAFQPDSGMTVGRSYHNDTSPPLRDMPQIPIGQVIRPEREANKNPKIPHQHKDAPDRVVQSQIRPVEHARADSELRRHRLPGVACNCAPPDTNGEVGATQYVQMVNEGYQVFDKTTGASVLGPSSIVVDLGRLRRRV